MTPEKQRIAIAEACGWHIKVSPKGIKAGEDSAGTLYNGARQPHGFIWISPGDTLADHSQNLPRYCTDLNAMREAIIWYQFDDRSYFLEALLEVCGNIEFLAVNATAEQRAEAFLIAIGKWEESK